MRFDEVLPALIEGKKIGRKKWNKGYYYEMTYKYGHNVIVDNYGDAKEDWEDVLATDWEVIKETKKVKLRDLTEEQFEEWRNRNCEKYDCFYCPFRCIDCNKEFRMSCKDMYSDKFLDQEIKVDGEEVDIKECYSYKSLVRDLEVLSILKKQLQFNLTKERVIFDLPKKEREKVEEWLENED